MMSLSRCGVPGTVTHLLVTKLYACATKMASLVGFEDFVTGFLSADGKTQFGRPVGLAIMPDGLLLFTDDTNGVIYQVA
jgi:glucose/arabinose dehydrogenase